MKENIKGRPGNRKPDGRKVQSPNKKPNPVAYEYTDEEYQRLLVKKQTEMESCFQDLHRSIQSWEWKIRIITGTKYVRNSEN